MGVESGDEKSTGRGFLQGFLQVVNSADGQVLGRTGGGFEHGWREAGSFAGGHDDALRAERVGAADDGTEVVGILHLVEKEEQGWSWQVDEQVVEVRVRRGCRVGDDTLVVGAGEAVELGLVAQIIGDVSLPCAGENFVDDRAVCAFGDEQTAQGTLGAQGFEHGVAAPD